MSEKRQKRPFWHRTEIKNNNISCDSDNDEDCDWKTTTNCRVSRDGSELQLLCRYNSCKAVANNSEGLKTAFRKENKSGLGTETYSILHKFLASLSCPELNLINI